MDNAEPGESSPSLSDERALEINSLLVGAWMVRNGLSGESLPPNFSRMSLADAIEASRLVAAMPPKPSPGGGVTLTCHVEPSRVPALYVWAIRATVTEVLANERHDSQGRERNF